MIRLLLTSFILICTTGYSQNALFIPFGQTEQEVQGYLASRDYIQEISQPAPDTLLTRIKDGWTVGYFLDDDRLYAVEDVRQYANKKEGDEIVQACINYLKMFDKKVQVVQSSGNKTHHAVALSDRMVELVVEEIGKGNKKSLIISLKTTSRQYGPRLQTESLIAKHKL